MSDTTRKTEEQKPVTAAPKTREEELNEAVERIYQRYGPDLDAFTRDVQREMLKIGGERVNGS